MTAGEKTCCSDKQILPEETMYRKKMGFSVPLADWLRGELKDLTYNYFFSKDAGLTNFFQYDPLRRLWDSHQAGKRNYATILWSLLMFELWYRKFIG